METLTVAVQDCQLEDVKGAVTVTVIIWWGGTSSVVSYGFHNPYSWPGDWLHSGYRLEVYLHVFGIHWNAAVL